MTTRALLTLLLVLLLAGSACAQSGFILAAPGTGRAACTAITSPVTNQTWCADGTLGPSNYTWKVWNGTTYVPISGGGGPGGITTINTVSDANVTLTGNLVGTTETLTTGWSGLLPMSRGGLGISSGNSGGVLFLSSPTTIASSGVLNNGTLVVGGGPGNPPSNYTGTTCLNPGDAMNGLSISGQAQCFTPAGTGTVTGTGTTNVLPIWTNGPGGILGDSHVDDGVIASTVRIGGADLFAVDYANTNVHTGVVPSDTGTNNVLLGTAGTLTADASVVGAFAVATSGAYSQLSTPPLQSGAIHLLGGPIQSDALGSIIGFNSGTVAGTADFIYGTANIGGIGDYFIVGEQNDFTGASSSGGHGLTLVVSGADDWVFGERMTLTGSDVQALGEQLNDGGFSNVVMVGQAITATKASAVYVGGTAMDTVLPNLATGGAAQCLQVGTDGTVTSTGAACGGAGSSPGAPNGAVQFNNAGAFGGDATFLFDSVTKKVTLADLLITNQATGGANECLQIDTSGNVTKTGSGCGSGTGNVTHTGTLTANAFILGNGGADVKAQAISGIVFGNGAAAPSGVSITGLVLGNGASAPTAYGGASCPGAAIQSLNASGVPVCMTPGNVTGSSLTTGLPIVGNGGTAITTFNGSQGSILFLGPSGVMAEDNANLNYNNITKAFRLGGKLAKYNNLAALDGQLLIGNTLTGNWDSNTLTCNPPLSCTFGHGSITMNSSAGAPGGITGSTQYNAGGVLGGSSAIVFVAAYGTTRAAIQSAITAAPTGGIVQFECGQNYVLDATTISVTKQLELRGCGMGGVTLTSGEPVPNAGTPIPILTVNSAAPVKIHGFTFSGALQQFQLTGGNQGSVIENNVFTNAVTQGTSTTPKTTAQVQVIDTGVNPTNQWVFRHNTVNGPLSIAAGNLGVFLFLMNGNNDSCECMISDNTFVSTVSGAQTQFHWAGSGDVRILNNKFLGTSGVTNIRLANGGIATSEIVIADNVLSTADINIAMDAGTSSVAGIVITGNEINGSSVAAIQITNAQFNKMTISSNVFELTAGLGINITAANQQISIVGNEFTQNGVGATAVNIGALAFQVTVGINHFSGFSTPVVNAGTAAVFLKGVDGTLANLGSPDNGSFAFCTNCNSGTTPCTSGGGGAFAVRRSSAWQCL